MTDFSTTTLPADPTVTAPDGSDVRVLLRLSGGSGQMWRRQGEREETVDLAPGTCLTIPVGTAFQFRAGDSEPLSAVAVTMPPWPGEDEAVFVGGRWR